MTRRQFLGALSTAPAVVPSVAAETPNLLRALGAWFTSWFQRPARLRAKRLLRAWISQYIDYDIFEAIRR